MLLLSPVTDTVVAVSLCYGGTPNIFLDRHAENEETLQAEDKAGPATSSSETSGHGEGEDGEEGPARRGLGGEAWEEQHTLSKTIKHSTRKRTQY